MGNTTHTLKRKVSRSSDALGSRNGSPLGGLEDAISSAGRMTCDFFHDVPIQGAIVGGAVGLYAATVLGVAELIAAGLSANIAYRMFALGESLPKACENTIKFETGELSKTDRELCEPIARIMQTRKRKENKKRGQASLLSA